MARTLCDLRTHGHIGERFISLVGSSALLLAIQACFACMLGGPDRRTLLLLTNDWRGIEHVDEALAARTGQILTAPAPAPAPGAGWP
jgi:hypothetical protein